VNVFKYSLDEPEQKSFYHEGTKNTKKKTSFFSYFFAEKNLRALRVFVVKRKLTEGKVEIFLLDESLYCICFQKVYENIFVKK